MISDHKFSKYFFYAIGEIILVVIGILIALQINNWNQNRLIQIEADNYISKLINDLVQDTININQTIKTVSERKSKIKTYHDFIKSGKPSLAEIVDSSKFSTGYQRYFPVNFTFMEMQSSGKLGLLDEYKRRKLMELANLHSFVQIAIDRTITDTKNELYEVRKYWEFDFANPKNEAIIDLQTFKKPENIERGLIHMNNYHNNMASLYDMLIGWVGGEIKSETIQTIELLKTKN